MTSPEQIELDRAHLLMMGVLDDEATAAEREELQAMVQRSAALTVEWERLQRVKGMTMTMGVAQPVEEFWDRYRRSILHRTERGLAWTMIVVGLAIPAALGVWRWIESWLRADVPLLVQVASGLLLGGVVVLLVSVVRERWVLSRRDPYNEVVR